MPKSDLNLYTRPRNESHERENWSKIEEFFTVIAEGSFPTLTNNETITITFGQPVYIDTGGGMQLAQANNIATSEVIGLVYEDTIAATQAGKIFGDGFITGTAAQWDVVTGGSGGLKPGHEYWLDSAASGKLTHVPPSASGHVVAPIGKAVNSTTLKLDINHTVILR